MLVMLSHLLDTIIGLLVFDFTFSFVLRLTDSKIVNDVLILVKTSLTILLSETC